MRVRDFKTWLIDVPFRFSFGHALASRSNSLNLIVQVELEDGSIGYGEGVPREYVTGETPQSSRGRAEKDYGPAVIGAEFDPGDPSPALRALREKLHAKRDPAGAAWCAVECALLDAFGHSVRKSASAFFGGLQRHDVYYSGVVPFGKATILAGILLFYRAYGFKAVKLKVGMGERKDIECLRLARKYLGPNAELRVDANCAWTADETFRMAKLLRPFGVVSYEQPVPADDIAGLKRLSADLPEAIIVDESLCSIDDARRLADAGACNAFNVRVSKCGGPLAALDVVEIAHQAGLYCQMGAQVGETGILSAAGRLVATVTPHPFRNLEGSDNRFLLKRDITREDLTVRWRGRGPALPGAGLGVTVLDERIDKLAQAGDAALAGLPGAGERKDKLDREKPLAEA